MTLPRKSIARAILTDAHFWIPAGVLVLGVVLLAVVR